LLKNAFQGREVEQGLKPSSINCGAYRPGWSRALVTKPHTRYFLASFKVVPLQNLCRGGEPWHTKIIRADLGGSSAKSWEPGAFSL